MASNWPILSLLIWLPIAGGLVVIAAGDQRASLARLLALVFSLATFVLSILLYTAFDTSTAAMQFTEMKPWIETFDIFYYLGVDGFSVPLILLTTFFGVLVVIAGWEVIQEKVHQYMAAFLIMEGLMVGVFSALDALLFYVFFEATLIPMFLVIGMWGGPRRVYATIKFFLYTFLGSVFMLIGLIYLYIQSGTWSILEWHQFPLSLSVQTWLFLGFLAAFSVKVPMWPVHTWLPDAHVEAPTGGSVVLAAIMLKIGGYGFIRFSLPVTPDASAALDWLVITLSLIAVVYIGFVALVQKDMKKLIAYSSISHMGFVTLGMFIAFAVFRNSESGRGAALGVEGAMVQMISHGFVSGALFLFPGQLLVRVPGGPDADPGCCVQSVVG
jgi:NADH-quinone oxidoreductase subunit M